MLPWRSAVIWLAVGMAEVMAEFLPPGVFNVICGDRETGAALVSHPTPQMASITGSVGAVARSARHDTRSMESGRDCTQAPTVLTGLDVAQVNGFG